MSTDERRGEAQQGGDYVGRSTPIPGLCSVHGGLMWLHALRACITPDDVIRGGCAWQSFEGEHA